MQIIKAARGRITGQFGDTDVPGANVKRHTGIDIGHGDKTPADLAVIAPASGTVTAVGWDGTYGLRIIIDHGGGWSSLLAHLAAESVAVGQSVAVGELLATMGGTGGDWPVHLHQELRYNGAAVDPAAYLTAASAGTGDQTTINTRRTGLMETVIQAPNGVVVHIYPGGKRNFTSVEEYNAYRDDIDFIKKRGGTNLMSLPLIQSVVGVTWERYARLCDYVGAPKG